MSGTQVSYGLKLFSSVTGKKFFELFYLFRINGNPHVKMFFLVNPLSASVALM